MLEGYGPIFQTLLGTLLTWGLTAAGAALVAVIPGTQKNVLDSSLGFAAGVMIAASYWSLLAPAVELAEESKQYGENGEYAWCPVALGFILGALFVLGADVLISSLGVSNPQMILALQGAGRINKEKDETYSPYYQNHNTSDNTTTIDGIFSDESS
ncbi:Zinc transporter ZIP11 [Frankliniella fusca]|uniref:Zinc transporter ZIP11 n=1 Tax=Frankliniella fusca TaxID=407009 RepID=A0AAE1H8S0_9NEOP|nr:Zinc transporter ZIP11 [Frankliniella fusca]